MSEQFAPEYITAAMRAAREHQEEPFRKTNAQGVLVRAMHAAVRVLPRLQDAETDRWGLVEDFPETPAIPAIDETDPEQTAENSVLLKGHFKYRREPDGLLLASTDVTVVGVFPGNERLDLCNIRSTRYQPNNLTRVRAFASYGEVNEPGELKNIANRVLYIARNVPRR